MVVDSQLIHGSDAKVKYAPAEFEGREVRSAFSEAVWQAYEAFRPP
jgi:hypothetical protein